MLHHAAYAAGLAALALTAAIAHPGATQQDKPPAAASDASGGTRTVLITGGNRGLGLEFARQYHQAGWNVIATARKPRDAKELQALARENSKVVIEQLDVTEDERTVPG